MADFSFETAAYVARYCMKKVYGKNADDHYVDKRTGLVKEREFTLMSRGGRMSNGRPGGIGAEFYERFKSDMYPFGQKVVRGRECKPPRYYDSLYEKEFPEAFARLKAKRNSLINVLENVTSRLLVKEEVTLNKISRLRRDFEYV